MIAASTFLEVIGCREVQPCQPCIVQGLACPSNKRHPGLNIILLQHLDQDLDTATLGQIHDVMRLSACATPLQNVFRPQWPLPIAQQRCSIHLLRATFPGPDEHPLATPRREIKDFEPVTFYKNPSQIHIPLRNYDASRFLGKMSLEKALKKFAKPGKLLLPMPRQKDSWKYAQQYLFKPIDFKKITHRIKRNHPPKEFHFTPSADTSSFELSMAEIWLFLTKGIPVEIHVHKEGPRNAVEFKKMLRAKIYLRPDVILAALPKTSTIMIDPQTNYEKVFWVIRPPYQNEKGKMVKVHSEVKELSKRKYGNLAAPKTDENNGVGVENFMLSP
jgi:hypothetical protein